MADVGEMWRSALEAIAEALCLVDPQGRILRCNGAFAALVGRTPGETEGEDCGAVVFGEPENAPEWPLPGALAAKAHREADSLVRGRWVRLAADPLLDETGALLGGVLSLADIDERKRAEDALRESSERYRYILDALPDPVFVKDEQHRWTILNDALCRFMGYTSDQLLGKSDFDFFPREEAEVFWAKDDETFASGAENVNEELFTDSSGTRHTISTKKSVYRDPGTGRQILVGIIRDVTEAKRTAEELRGYREHLEDIVRERTDDLATTNAQLVREAQERVRVETMQAAIFEILEAAHQTKNLDQLFVRIHSVVARLMEAKNLYIALYDATANLVSFPYFVDEEDLPPQPRRPGRGLTEYILRTGRPLLATPEVFEGLVVRGEVESMGASSIDWLGVPLDAGNSTIGVLAVQSYRGGVRYGEREKEILTFVSRQVAVAVERKAAEDALRESEEKFRTTVEGFSQGLVLIDEDGRVIEWNAALERIVGVPREEAIGQPLWDVDWRVFLPERKTPERYEELKRSVLQAVRHGVLPSLPSEASIRSLDGTIRTVHQSVFCIGTEKGYRIGTAVTEITDRKKAEEALRESEERYRSFFEQSPMGIYQTTPDGRIVAANPALLRMLGFGSFAELAVHNLERDSFEPGYPRVAFKESVERDGEVWGLESTWKARDGTPVFVRENARAVRGADGTVLYYEGMVEDITRWMAVKEEHRRLTAAIEQAAETIVITDTDGRIQYVNPAFERITGYAREDVIGQKPSVVKSGRHDGAYYAALWRTIKAGETWQGHFVNRRKDGSLYEEDATISPIRNASGAIVNFVAVKRDVTQEVALEAQLRQAQKMEAVGHLAGGVAHDFNNLLQSMLSQTQLLRSHPHDGARSATVVRELEQQIQRGASLTRQLLLFSRRETAKTEHVDLNDAVREATQILQRLVRANIALSTELAGGQLPVEADRGQLQQVLMNLTLNASDAMPLGGELTVRTGEADREWVWLTVEDTGQGIPKANRERIFEPFFTTKDPGKGTGLGLSVVYGIVTSHGGQIEVESAVGRGSTFRVILPRAASDGHVAEHELPPAAAAATAGKGERILVVEDEDGARAGLRDILISLGYTVAAVGSGEEATACQADQPFDLLLTDFMLPGMMGPQVALELQARWPALKVILMSGYAEDETVRRGVSQGKMRFLQKPFGMDNLAHEVRATLDERPDPAGA